MQGFCKPQSSAQARKEAPFNGGISIKVMLWFVEPLKRGQYPYVTPNLCTVARQVKGSVCKTDNNLVGALPTRYSSIF